MVNLNASKISMAKYSSCRTRTNMGSLYKYSIWQKNGKEVLHGALYIKFNGVYSIKVILGFFLSTVSCVCYECYEMCYLYETVTFRFRLLRDSMMALWIWEQSQISQLIQGSNRTMREIISYDFELQNKSVQILLANESPAIFLNNIERFII